MSVSRLERPILWLSSPKEPYCSTKRCMLFLRISSRSTGSNFTTLDAAPVQTKNEKACRSREKKKKAAGNFSLAAQCSGIAFSITPKNSLDGRIFRVEIFCFFQFRAFSVFYRLLIFQGEEQSVVIYPRVNTPPQSLFFTVFLLDKTPQCHDRFRPARTPPV
jgi:hypothetical protein